MALTHAQIPIKVVVATSFSDRRLLLVKLCTSVV
jgi:hypothetical protein